MIEIDLRLLRDQLRVVAVVRHARDAARARRCCGNVRVLSSRDMIMLNTRVMSAWNASACRSNISLVCSSNESGMSVGRSGSSMSHRLRFGVLDALLDLAHRIEILAAAWPCRPRPRLFADAARLPRGPNRECCPSA